MTLVITFLAAAIVTALWYAKAPNSDMRLGTLALMYWGAALMWCVDGINGLIEGEGFIEIADTAAMLDDAAMVVPGLGIAAEVVDDHATVLIRTKRLIRNSISDTRRTAMPGDVREH